MKRLFFEMEMVSLNDVHDFERDLRVRDCHYVMAHSEPVAFDDSVLYESVAFYGELPEEYAELGAEESCHGYDSLKDKYEQTYGI